MAEELDINFKLTQKEADVLIAYLEDATMSGEYTPVFDEDQDPKIAKAFAASIRIQAGRPRP